MIFFKLKKTLFFIFTLLTSFFISTSCSHIIFKKSSSFFPAKKAQKSKNIDPAEKLKKSKIIDPAEKLKKSKNITPSIKWNYKEFCNSFKNINLTNFAEKYSSISVFFNKIKNFYDDKSLSFSVNNLDINKIFLSDITDISSKGSSYRINLSDFDEIDNKFLQNDKNNNILFKIAGKFIPLQNLLFSSNFDLKITNNSNKKSMIFSNITAFFNLSHNKNKKDFTVTATNWSNSKVKKIIPKASFINQCKLNFSSDKNSFDLNKSDLGIPQNGKNLWYGQIYKGSDLEKWNTKGSRPIASDLFTIKNNTINFSNNEITVDASNLLIKFASIFTYNQKMTEKEVALIFAFIDSNHNIVNVSDNYFAAFKLNNN